jgi:hypothetical protein
MRAPTLQKTRLLQDVTLIGIVTQVERGLFSTKGIGTPSKQNPAITGFNNTRLSVETLKSTAFGTTPCSCFPRESSVGRNRKAVIIIVHFLRMNIQTAALQRFIQFVEKLAFQV